MVTVGFWILSIDSINVIDMVSESLISTVIIFKVQM